MRRRMLSALVSIALGCISLSLTAHGATITFGNGANTFQIEFVQIGSPGNAADTTGNPIPVGAVGYAYNLAKYEVSRDMIDKANNLGALGIVLHDALGGNGPNRPATGVSWYEAATFVNWLNTSQGYHAAYNFDGNGNFQLWTPSDVGYNPNNLYRNSLANYVLPTVDELYKGAYFDPNANGGMGGYWNYPTGSDSPPTPIAGGTAPGTAVFNQPVLQGPADVYNAGGLSPFGTMGQGGNVYEWEETAFDLSNDLPGETRGYRGGYWFDVHQLLSVYTRGGLDPGWKEHGFRVASLASAEVPEPSTLALWTLGGVCAIGWYRRRVKA